ncbi:ABC transporter ATP-binding protein [Corynebacterium falsenii]|uniref:ABC transporter ATP-binding protein n=1 Tax=Corynebacterium falsenii TaxID=108486 RepID=UPI00234C374A|nr:ABC transporter ATP-binding protein [Corynebacterium falsenii]MDC7104673.1 ABC transporter ATP-binding protein [Corynebacterium falsenii]
MVNSIGVEPAVELTDLVVRRGKTEVLHGLTCCLPAGSITGLLGPSGCGKTTLMRTIVGAQRITSGSLRVLGLPAGSKELRRRMAYTSQTLSVYPDISVRANVTYFAGLLGFDRTATDTAIERVGLTEYADRRVDQLSGGQANRVSLACALVGRPEVLILDEPTVGLDPLTRESLWDTFHTLADGGTTMVVSSHVMDEAARCDSVLFMRDGRFLAHEPVDSVQQRTGTANPEEAFLALIRDDMESEAR